MPSTSSSINAKAYFQLIRAPGLFSIVSNILAASLIFHWLKGNESLFIASDFVILLGVSLCCYQVGMITNDIADIREDTAERPFRPIPSGRVSQSLATYAAVSFSLLALVLSATYSWSLLVGTACLLSAIFSYNFLTKATLVGPINMASVRLLNYLLVASLYSEISLSFVIFCLMVFLYTWLITVISRYETVTFPSYVKPGLYAIVALMALVYFALLQYSQISLINTLPLAGFVAWLLFTIYRFTPQTPQHTQQMVTTLLKNMVLLDALILACCGLFGYALLCASLLLLSKKTAQYVYLT